MSDTKDSICPTCGKLLPTAQLAQLNVTLQQLLEIKEICSNTRTELVKRIVNEIERASQQIGSPGVTELERLRKLVHALEAITPTEDLESIRAELAKAAS